MQVKDIMTKNPACCTAETTLQEVAKLMLEHDCGETPVVDNKKSGKMLGVITDRDITIRTVAEGRTHWS
jgi:CBS domain-containing protein